MLSKNPVFHRHVYVVDNGDDDDDDDDDDDVERNIDGGLMMVNV